MTSRTVFIIPLLALLWGCDEVKPRPVPAYPVGSFVKTVVGDFRGQVIRAYCVRGEESCYLYKVRLVVPQITTNTKLLGSDRPVEIAPLSALHFYPFEIISAEKL